MWQLAAAAAVPVLAGMLTPQPKAPSTEGLNIRLPDRGQYTQQLLNTGFDTNSSTYKLAANEMANKVNQQMALLGLTGSSLHNQTMAQNQNLLAQSFIDEALKRQQSAYSAVTGYDLGQGNLQANVQQNLYNAQAGQYQNEVAKRNSMIQGFGSLASAGAQMYGMNQQQQMQQQMLNQQNNQFQQLYNLNAAQQMGVPYQPANYAGGNPMPGRVA